MICWWELQSLDPVELFRCLLHPRPTSEKWRWCASAQLGFCSLCFAVVSLTGARTLLNSWFNVCCVGYCACYCAFPLFRVQTNVGIYGPVDLYFVFPGVRTHDLCVMQLIHSHKMVVVRWHGMLCDYKYLNVLMRCSYITIQFTCWKAEGVVWLLSC